MMLGYIHKDQHQPHFQVKLHNINAADVIKGTAEWQTAKLSYEDDKIMITKPNIFHRLSTYRLNANPESDESFLEMMTHMLNTKKYMVSTAFITQSGALRLPSAEAMWKLVKGNGMKISDTQDLFFQQPYTPYRPGAAVAGQRFFDPPVEGPTFEETDVPITATEGFMATDHPQGPVPSVTADCLSPFVRRQLDAVYVRTRVAIAGIHFRHRLLRLRCARLRTPPTRMPQRRSVRIRLGLLTRARTIRMLAFSMMMLMMLLTRMIFTHVSRCARATARTPCKWNSNIVPD